MTRQDYLMLSGALRRAHARSVGPSETRGVEYAAQEIGKSISDKNRAFDYPRFITDSDGSTQDLKGGSAMH